MMRSFVRCVSNSKVNVQFLAKLLRESGEGNRSISSRMTTWLLSLISITTFALGTGAVPAVAGSTYAYVANNCDNSVSYINTGVPAIVGVASGVGLGPTPTGVAVDPTGTWVWVANQTSNTVAVLNAGVPAVYTSFSVGANPVTIDFNPKGGFAYVTLAGANAVAVVNTTTYAVVATVPVGPAPTRVAVDPKGRFVYVSNQNSNYISIIDTATNTVTANVTVGFDPTTIVFSPDGRLAYVEVGGANIIAVINTTTRSIVGRINGLVAPLSLTINADGTLLYASSQAANAVWVIDTTTNSVISSTYNVFSSGWPGDLAFTPDGTQVYVTNPGANYVGIIDVASNTLSPLHLATGACPSLLAIAKPKKNVSTNGVTVSITPPAFGTIVGVRTYLVATATRGNGQIINSATFSWASSNPASLRVSAPGIVDALSRGTATVTAVETQSGASSTANAGVSADQFFWTANAQEYSQALTNNVLWTDQGVVFGFSTTGNDLNNQSDPNLVPLWRFLDPSTSTHFWTVDPAGELFTGTPVIREGSAGFVFSTQEQATVPIYRFNNPSTGVHFWSTDPNGEGVAGTGSGFELEGIAYYAFPAGTTDSRYAPVHRAGCQKCFLPFNQQ
jgi:YVTN family beta-propeller protein